MVPSIHSTSSDGRALEEALELPVDERRARRRRDPGHVRAHDLARWIDAQLADLDRASTMLRR